MTDDEQFRVVLTAHPLQRVGAYAFARLAGAARPEAVTPDRFREATTRMTDDATRAALFRDSKHPDGFWLKSSRAFFPNAKMNHPSIARASDDELRAGVAAWRAQPDPAGLLGTGCVLCGRTAVKFFGKMDVPLAESHVYRNTTPRGHEGTALCWPCVCSFYALPYGCRLTGGLWIVLHSWDDDFLRDTVSRRVSGNLQIMEAGRDAEGQVLAREVVALDALRRYDQPIQAGVELLVASNDNRRQSLDSYAMEQPLAEWLRRRAGGRAYGALLRAHQTANTIGRVGLARNAFREPARIVRACARYLAGPAAERGALGPETPALAELTYSYVEEVMTMDQKDLTEIKETAVRLAALLAAEQRGGKLNAFYARFRNQRQLRGWLQHEAVYWALQPAEPDAGPLLTTRGYELLFGPGIDGQAWFHRELLLIALLEDLYRRKWRPVDAEDVLKDLPADPDRPDPDEHPNDEEVSEQ